MSWKGHLDKIGVGDQVHRLRGGWGAGSRQHAQRHAATQMRSYVWSLTTKSKVFYYERPLALHSAH